MLRLLKVLVASLVLANFGYFLWTRGVGARPPAAAPPPPPGLLLAAEAPPAGGAPRTGSIHDEPSASAPMRESGMPPAPDAALFEGVKRCITVGPFRDVAEAAHAASLLRRGGYDPRQRVEDGEVWSGLWVYVPLPPAAGSAEQMLAKLKAGGIDDALEMPGPADTAVMSLGLFLEPKRAQARVAQARALGFNPLSADRKRTGNVYWIDIDLKPTDSMLRATDLQGESGRIVRLEVKGCPAETPP